MIQLYGSPHNRAFRTYWMLEELGLEYEEHRLDTQAGECRTGEFLAINPNGHVPTLVDGDVTVWESMAINLYLARRYGGPLAPQGTAAEANAYQWSFWAMTEAEPPLLDWGMHTFYLPEAERNAELAKAAREKLAGAFGVLERVLGERAFLAGESFGLADLNVASVLSWVEIMHYEPSAFPTAAAWLARCLERPAVAKVRSMSGS